MKLPALSKRLGISTKLKRLLQYAAVFVAVSVFLNLCLLYRLSQVQRQLAQEISRATLEAQRAHSAASDVSYQLRQLKDEQEWLAQADFTLEDVSAEGALLTGTFDLRSAAPGAQVVLQVRAVPENGRPPWTGTGTARPTEENAWHDFPADPQTELTYKAKFTLSPDKNYEYRLVSRSPNAVSASPIRQLPPHIYRRPSLVPQISWSEDGNGKLIAATIGLDYSYMHESSPLLPAFKPVSATLDIVQENGAVTTHEFTPGSRHEEPLFVLENLTDLPPNAQLFAAVRYANGYVMNVNIGGTDNKCVPYTP